MHSKRQFNNYSSLQTFHVLVAVAAAIVKASVVAVVDVPVSTYTNNDRNISKLVHNCQFKIFVT